jgi:RNA polymerase sigma factor (sigma-70 family)
MTAAAISFTVRPDASKARGSRTSAGLRTERIARLAKRASGERRRRLLDALARAVEGFVVRKARGRLTYTRWRRDQGAIDETIATGVATVVEAFDKWDPGRAAFLTCFGWYLRGAINDLIHFWSSPIRTPSDPRFPADAARALRVVGNSDEEGGGLLAAIPTRPEEDEASGGGEVLRLREAVASLPEFERTILRDVDGVGSDGPARSLAEVAASFGVSRETARERRNRAIRILRATLVEEPAEPFVLVATSRPDPAARCPRRRPGVSPEAAAAAASLPTVRLREVYLLRAAGVPLVDCAATLGISIDAAKRLRARAHELLASPAAEGIPCA